MTPERRIPCPLCSVPVKPKFLSPAGTCFNCADQKKFFIRDVTSKAYEEDQRHVSQSKQLHNRLIAFAETKIKREAERKRLKQLEAEKQQLQEMYREQASIALAKRSLLHYTERYSPGYDASWLHEDICRRLEKFFDDIVAKRSPRLILCVPSRAGKSLLASITAPAWALGNWPWMKFILASYSDVLPVSFSRAIRDQIQSPEFRSIFPSGAHLSKDDASVKSWSTAERGGLWATGTSGSLLGVGADCIIVDDPVKGIEEASSVDALDKIYDWFSSVCYSRQLPGAGICIVMQRMSTLDLVGRLTKKMREEELRVIELRNDAENILKDSYSTPDQIQDANLLLEEANELEESMDRWTVVEYPALAIADEYLDTDTGEIVKLNNAEPSPNMRLLRRVGEALHPKRYNRSYLLKIKRANPLRWACMYQLNPVSEEGAYFSESDFKRYPVGKHPNLQNMHVYCAWDQALGTKQTNDYTVGIAGGTDYEGNLWLFDRIKGRFGDVREVSDLIIDLHTRWGASVTGIERNMIEMATGPILRSRMQERKQFIALAEGTEALKPISDKFVRARTFQGLCKAGKVYVPEGDDWDGYIRSMTNFGVTGAHDDDVDASAWLAILASRNGLPRDPKSLRDKPNKLMDLYDRLFKKAETGIEDYMSS